MNKLLSLIVLIGLVGCAEKKPLTDQEQWKGYCTSVGNAANNIMFDRQNAIDKTAALEHANKVEDEITKTFVLAIVEEVYAFPLDELKADPDQKRAKYKKKIMEKCILTPHDRLPNYKPF